RRRAHPVRRAHRDGQPNPVPRPEPRDTRRGAPPRGPRRRGDPVGMTVREIRLYGDPVLRTPCAEIETIDDGVRALVADLIETVELPGRAGVAAPQIGVGLRAFSYNVDGRVGAILNPRIVEVRGEPVPTGEGCLSVPNLWHDALRHPYARVSGLDVEGDA